MLSSHYAPRAKLRLNARDVRPGEALLAFGPEAPAAATTLNLSASADLIDFPGIPRTPVSLTSR